MEVGCTMFCIHTAVNTARGQAFLKLIKTGLVGSLFDFGFDIMVSTVVLAHTLLPTSKFILR